MKIHPIILTTAILLIAAVADAQITAPDVVGQIQNLRGKGDTLGCRLSPDLPIPSINFHYQGFARHPDPRSAVLYATLAYPCNTPGYNGGGALAVIDINWADVNNSWRLRSNRLSTLTLDSTMPRSYDKMVNVIRFPDEFHPSGIQTCGHYLAMGLSSGEYGCTSPSTINIYDISDPYNPVLFDVVAANTGAGCLGFTQQSNGRYVLIGDYGSGGITFNESSGPSPSDWTTYHWDTDDLISEDPNDLNATWPSSGSGTYEPQAFGLVQGTDYPGTERVESLYLLSFRNTSAVGALTDRIEVYGVDVHSPSGLPEVWKITTRDFPNDNSGNFSAAGSLWVAPDGELIVYKCPHYNTGPLASFSFVEHSSYKGNWNGVANSSNCVGHVQLYTGVNRADDTLTAYSIGVDSVDVLYEDYSFLGNVDPVVVMNESISSIAWTLPVGCTCRLYEHPDFNPVGGHYLDLVGTGYTEEYSDLSNVTWTNGGGNANNKISSLRFLGNRPGPGAFTTPGPFVSSLFAPILSLSPTNVCTVMKAEAGFYPTSGFTTMSTPVTIHAVDGIVTIGNP